jgi:hypothetical protein
MSRKQSTSLFARIVIGAVLTVVLGFALLVLYAAKSHWFPRLDLPTFDERKAAELSPAKRAAYEQELFSQIDLWNIGSKHYPDAEGISRREARWKEMAAEGFELAHITLRVLRPSNGTTYSLRWPAKRLQLLAERGDVGAMCLMVRLVNQAAIKQDWRPYASTAKKWLDEGARLQHPECLLARGERLMAGSADYAQDVRAGLAEVVAGLRKGYSHGADALIPYFKGQGFADRENVKRLYCWSSIADQFWTGDKYLTRTGVLISQLQQQLPPPDAKDWQQFIETLRESKYSVNDCINLGTGE